MKIEISGNYFGTEIEEKWWKRYTKNKMLARGNGMLWFNEQSIFFLRLLTKKPIKIDIKQIVDIKTGTWHSGQWGAGKPIIKIVWENNGQILSSGFTVSKGSEAFEKVLSGLKNLIKNKDRWG
jgi:hypothetical protein